jgi:hypothetical protein
LLKSFIRLGDSLNWLTMKEDTRLLADI